MSANGHSRVLRAGVWAPIPTFMDDNEEIGELGGVAVSNKQTLRLSSPTSSVSPRVVWLLSSAAPWARRTT